LREFLLKRKIKDADWPAFITSKVVNQITLLVNLIVKQLVTHCGLLYATVHEKLVQKVESRFTSILLANSFDWHLVKLLVIKSCLLVIFSILLYFFVFKFVFRKIGDLNDAISILELGWNGLEHFHDVLKTSVAHYLGFHHVKNCKGNPKKYF
jgi:hypothetical protein